MFFCDLRVLVRKLPSPFGHPTQVSTQVQLASTCDYLRLRLARALEEPHQLTKFIGPLKPYLAENISLQSSDCNILGLAATVAFFANEARFTQIQEFFRACSLQNEVCDPPIFFFFYISGMANSSSFNGKIFRKNQFYKKVRANVLDKVKYV